MPSKRIRSGRCAANTIAVGSEQAVYCSPRSVCRVLEPTLPDLQSLIGQQGLDLLQRHGLLEALVERLLISELIRDIQLDEATISAAREAYGKQHNLPTEEALQERLTSSGINPELFDEQLQRPARMAQLARDQFSAKAESRFLAQKNRLDRVVYSLLRLNNHSQAQELYLRIAHEEADFSELAGRYSEGSERNTNGVIGPVPLNQSHPVLSEKLRAAQQGTLLEPFRVDRWWVVARLERFAPATFDERMADQMSMELLQEWVKQETSRTLSALSQPAPGSAPS